MALYINDVEFRLLNGSLAHARAHHRVDHVQADGAELSFIYDHFENIPKAWAPRDDPKPFHTTQLPAVAQWWGNMAQFIAGNLQ